MEANLTKTKSESGNQGASPTTTVATTNSCPCSLTKGNKTGTPAKEPLHKVLVGHTAFREYVKELKLLTKIIYFYFVGTKDSFGISWCSDCNAAESIVEAAWNKYKNDNSEFIMVDVGDRATFKDKENSFRLDKDVHLTSIPTLIRWGTQRRLETAQLLSSDLLEMFFTEED